MQFTEAQVGTSRLSLVSAFFLCVTHAVLGQPASQAPAGAVQAANGAGAPEFRAGRALARRSLCAANRRIGGS